MTNFYFIFYLHKRCFFMQTMCMSITFILFGIILIFYLFGVKGSRLNFTDFSFIAISVLVVSGYFIGDIFIGSISLNVLHLFAFALMLFLLSGEANLKQVHLMILPIILEVLILNANKNCSLFYSWTLYFSCVVYFVFLSLLGIKNCTSLLSKFSLIYLCVDSIFQFVDLQQIYINLDCVLLSLLSLYAFEIFFDYLRAKNNFLGGDVCEKIK